MFERFTKEAGAIVKAAVARALKTDGGGVTPEHLLLAVLDERHGPTADVLARLGAAERRESMARAVEESRRRAGLSQADTEALAELGIDVAEIVARVEETHGVGALSSPGDGFHFRRGDTPRGPRSHRHVSFSRGAKETLGKSLRIAAARKERRIGAEHILLALLVRPGIAAEVMADHGVTYTAVERLLPASAEAR
ncbi:Clp protease N-terminal domain-containing protein [Streptomyces sp. NPDC050560]|uniref:Clp protease N-terminal domain-containing protein n=1 Tax=Streptomyces sp. NPDC050560 TaxID=3365630 RepID=UPI0037A11739